VQQTASLFDGLCSLHNSKKADREGRAAAHLALDRNVASHHLTEAAADSETKARATVFARRAEEAWENSWNRPALTNRDSTHTWCSGANPILKIGLL
jgi:hypothetical protein